MRTPGPWRDPENPFKVLTPFCFLLILLVGIRPDVAVAAEDACPIYDETLTLTPSMNKARVLTVELSLAGTGRSCSDLRRSAARDVSERIGAVLETKTPEDFSGSDKIDALRDELAALVFELMAFEREPTLFISHLRLE